MSISLALVVGALGAVLGPTLARAASVLHRRWPSVGELSRGLLSWIPSPSGELALAPPGASSHPAHLGDVRERGDRRPERRRTVACTVGCASLFTLAAQHWGGT